MSLNMTYFTLVKENMTLWPLRSGLKVDDGTLLLYILTNLSLRSFSILSLTSNLSWFRCCTKSVEGCADSGMSPQKLSRPDPFTFLPAPVLGSTTGLLFTVSGQSSAPCWPSPSPSTQRRLATEKGEVKERLDLFSLSFREELSLW